MSRLSMRGPEWTKVSRFVKARDDYMCQVCGDTEDLTVDHVFPLNKMTQDMFNDGLHLDPANLTTLCRVHNGRKQDKTLERVSWVNPQLLTMIPPSSMPAFLRGTGQSGPSREFHANEPQNFENASIAREVV